MEDLHAGLTAVKVAARGLPLRRWPVSGLAVGKVVPLRRILGGSAPGVEAAASSGGGDVGPGGRPRSLVLLTVSLVARVARGWWKLVVVRDHPVDLCKI